MQKNAYLLALLDAVTPAACSMWSHHMVAQDLSHHLLAQCLSYHLLLLGRIPWAPLQALKAEK